MADNKILYDVDFNVHTESISQGVAKAVAAGLGSIDKAIQSLGERVGHPYLYEDVRNNLGIIGESGAGLSVSEFAALAASPKYNYTPSTIQTMIRHAADVALKDRETSVDMQYKLDMEEAINKLRAVQNRVKKSSLASEYQQQGQMYYALAEAASSPEEKRILLSRAASRYGSIGARTLLESGAVSPEAAVAALSNAATLGALRSDIMTDNQILAYNARVWKNSPNVTEPKAEAAFAATKASQEDLAWASRGYDEKQKTREMEMGFRAMEASSATEEVYNTNEGPATEHSITNAIAAAGRYIRRAEEFEEGSAQREAMLTLASSSVGGITPGSMSKAGMSADKIAANTLALTNLTEQIKALSGSGPSGDGGGSGFWERILTPAFVAGAVTGTVGIAANVMGGRTQWLADTKTPYATRRDVRQNWAIEYGKAGTAVGAGVGAKIGGAIGGIPGMIGGALIGAIPGAVSWLTGQHYKDEKKLGDSYQARAIGMNSLYALYGDRVDYNYAQLAGGTGYVSQEAVLGVTQAADYLPGAMAFGAVNEQQMMALSYMPNYYRAILEGAGTADLLAAYKNDIENIPPMYRQYISSLLPGINEEIRGFVSTSAYDQIASYRNELKGYDWQQRATIPALERTKVELSRRDVADVNKNMMNEIPKLNSPNLLGALDNSWNTADVGLLRGVPYGSMAAPGSGSMRMTELTEAILSAVQKGPYDKEKTLGDLIINIDGVNVVHEELKPSDFIHQTQTYMVGGA